MHTSMTNTQIHKYKHTNTNCFCCPSICYNSKCTHTYEYKYKQLAIMLPVHLSLQLKGRFEGRKTCVSLQLSTKERTTDNKVSHASIFGPDIHWGRRCRMAQPIFRACFWELLYYQSLGHGMLYIVHCTFQRDHLQHSVCLRSCTNLG